MEEERGVKVMVFGFFRDLGDNENITECQVIHAYYDHHVNQLKKEMQGELTFLLLLFVEGY